MSIAASFRAVLGQENVNFLLTNRIPRAALTRFMGRFSKVEWPPIRALSIAGWKLFCDVDLSDARPERFRSLHHAFVRQLRDGARRIDPDPGIVASPCDAIVGAFGRIEQGTALQIKGAPYPVADLLGSTQDAAEFDGGWFITLRLTAGMYHRFHAPHDLMVEKLRYISGDCWNVNPIALRRIERLFCKNERAPMSVRLDADGSRMMLVPVAAVLVASIRLPWLNADADLRGHGDRIIPCAAQFAKGQEMGWFEHGSTIVVLSPPQHRPATGLETGQRIRLGQALLQLR